MRKGLTLAELLIVIVVIGILASAFVLSSTETITTAKATKIIADMHNLKRATLAWYADHRDYVKSLQHNGFGKNTRIQTVDKDDVLGIGKYLHGGSEGIPINKMKGGSVIEKLQQGSYAVYNVYGHRTTWYVGYCFKDDEQPVKYKIINRSKAVGLIFAQHWPDPYHDDYNPNARVKDLTGYETVWLYAMGDGSNTVDWWGGDQDAPNQ